MIGSPCTVGEGFDLLRSAWCSGSGALLVVDFFNRINLVYGIITDYCTRESCPTMSGGPRYEYRYVRLAGSSPSSLVFPLPISWCDGAKYKKPASLPAPDYITLLMEWVETIINDESIFPVHVGTPFPKCFRSTCKKLLARLYRVFVHVYVHHFDRIIDLQAVSIGSLVRVGNRSSS